jgi:hypothetical protein
MRRSSFARLAATAVAIVGVTSACRISDANAPLTPCSQPLSGITIQLQSGTPAQFEWSPECTLGGVVIETAGVTAPGADLWIISDPKARIEGPLQYGIVPTNASEVLASTPMVSGQKYRIHLIGAAGQELYAADFTY